MISIDGGGQKTGDELIVKEIKYSQNKWRSLNWRVERMIENRVLANERKKKTMSSSVMKGPRRLKQGLE